MTSPRDLTNLPLRTLDSEDTVAASQPRAIRVRDDQGPTLALEPRYQDAGPIGRGGMGQVRALRDLTLGREIAAKTLDGALAGRTDIHERFVEEAQITAQLEHPNIVPVYDHARDREGTLFFTMKRVLGRTLLQLLSDPALAVGSSERLSVALEVFLKTCDAIAYAHSRGVLHRDIKPANIMVGAFGEVYLMDWGLAKMHGSRPGGVEVLRRPSSVLEQAVEGPVGTPSFMAPEMVNGQHDRIDERADIFGLGAVLYQIVTGRPPFTGTTVQEIMVKNGACDFVPADAIGDAFVPKKLAHVIARAMAREPEDRYANASELSSQVREFLHRGMHLPRETFEAGQTIVREGELGERAYIITRGRCQAFKVLDGERTVLREMGPGSLFGEAAILSSAPRIASVDALTDVTLLVLTREVLEDSFSPDTWEGLLAKTLVERFRELDARMTALGREELVRRD